MSRRGSSAGTSKASPVTGESTTYLMDGVLPVNTDGNGIGQLSFDIQLKPGLAEGTEIPNRATIIFDENAPIETPTWTNVIGPAAMQGDVNGDGSVTAQDASLILQHVAGKNTLDEAPGTSADVNGDGSVTAQDASLILQYVAGKTSW